MELIGLRSILNRAWFLLLLRRPGTPLQKFVANAWWVVVKNNHWKQQLRCLLNSWSERNGRGRDAGCADLVLFFLFPARLETPPDRTADPTLRETTYSADQECEPPFENVGMIISNSSGGRW